MKQIIEMSFSILLLLILISTIIIYYKNDNNNTQEKLINLKAQKSVQKLTNFINKYCKDNFASNTIKIETYKNYKLYYNKTKICIKHNKKKTIYCSHTKCELLSGTIYNNTPINNNIICKISKIDNKINISTK